MPECPVNRKELRQHPKRRPGKSGWRFVLYSVALAILVLVGVRALLVDVFYIPSGSMEPLLETGDRVVVSRADYVFGEIERGDVVVFDGRGSFSPLGPGGFAEAAADAARFFGIGQTDTVYVKRVLGAAGDTVACCDAEGRVTVNGNGINEPYVFPSDAPSDTNFEVVVPKGKLWLMGDHRSESFDSRDLLGAPGGGLVSEDRIIGRAIGVIWPFERLSGIPRPGDAPSSSGTFLNAQ